MSYQLGIDIGGTFTDIVLLNEETGQLSFGKTLTTYGDPTDGIITGVRETLADSAILPQHISRVLHGTTLVANAVIERKGAKTGILTTSGFEDVLEIGRELRYDIYDLNLAMPEPLVPRYLRMGVRERIDKRGNILERLDKDHLALSVDKLVQEGVESIAVCYLFGFANPVHERQTEQFIEKRYPEVYVSISSNILPEIREYERSSATVMNAYVQPITHRYMSDLEERLREIGISAVINIMLSSGRLTTVEGAKEIPIHLLESGPAGGTMAGVFVGRQTDRKDLLTFDMGGTTAKASLINDHQPEITHQFEAARVRRFRRGSGLPVHIPVIDMIEIGAGGGSIARVNRLGLLKVGPESASSDPGPACYDQGGELPTVTDADLILGYLNEDYFLGGTMRLDKARAVEVVRKQLAEPLGVSVEEAALGVHRVVNENMANAARVHILEKGYDPRHYAMMAFGGAGPVHAFQVARLLNVKQVLAPVGAGVASAIGFLVSPVAVEHVRSHVGSIDSMDWDVINSILQEMEDEGRQFLENAGVQNGKMSVARSSDMRYLGQGFEVKVPIPSTALSETIQPMIEGDFSRVYANLYGRTIENVPIETVTWRVLTEGPLPEIEPYQVGYDGKNDAVKSEREVVFPDIPDPVVCPVYDRYRLSCDDEFAGPAIVEERESTFVIGPDSHVSIDNQLNIVVDLA